MQTVETKVQVNADRTVTLQLPADVQMGDYEQHLIEKYRKQGLVL
jgi:hypothetical protein